MSHHNDYRQQPIDQGFSSRYEFNTNGRGGYTRRGYMYPSERRRTRHYNDINRFRGSESNYHYHEGHGESYHGCCDSEHTPSYHTRYRVNHNGHGRISSRGHKYPSYRRFHNDYGDIRRFRRGNESRFNRRHDYHNGHLSHDRGFGVGFESHRPTDSQLTNHLDHIKETFNGRKEVRKKNLERLEDLNSGSPSKEPAELIDKILRSRNAEDHYIGNELDSLELHYGFLDSDQRDTFNSISDSYDSYLDKIDDGLKDYRSSH